MSIVGWGCMMGLFALWSGVAFWFGFNRGRQRPRLRLVKP